MRRESLTDGVRPLYLNAHLKTGSWLGCGGDLVEIGVEAGSDRCWADAESDESSVRPKNQKKKVACFGSRKTEERISVLMAKQRGNKEETDQSDRCRASATFDSRGTKERRSIPTAKQPAFASRVLTLDVTPISLFSPLCSFTQLPPANQTFH